MVQNTHRAYRLKVRWCLILEVVWVGNLSWGPNSLVRWVVNVFGCPFTFILRILLGWLLPFTAAGSFLTFGVWYAWWDPISVFLIIPIFRLLSLWVWDHRGLVLKPVVRLCGFLVDDFIWCILIPVFWFCGFRVRDSCFINPVLRLGILGIINLFFGVHCWSEVLEKATLFHFLSINVDDEGLIRIYNQSVQRAGLDNASHWCALEMLLLVLSSLWILVLENKVNL